MARFRLFAISALAVAMVALGCGKKNKTPTPVVPTETTRFQFSFSRIAELDSAYYQAWALIGNYGYNLGKFNINSSGQMVDTAGAVVADNAFFYNMSASMVTAVGITIQDVDDSTSSPSGAHLLGGSVANGTASLSMKHEAGINKEFGSVTGKFILATPTNGTNSDETSGIWFIDNSDGVTTAGLTLPSFSSGWQYEGWISVDGKFYSTGTFTGMSAADDSARYSADIQTAPDFPGEDFLANAPAGITFPLDLSGKYTMVTLEPKPDPAVGIPSPFVLLEATIASDAADNQTYNMVNTATASLPSGTVTLTTQ